ncbi:MAG: BrnA antitoxin family protein [Candidatus Accumulibacter sp.]|jgi:uncharacterized protein (DUF4415 family)|nr:BrnA antitoxin family protein [Accumulibacter sp.]
MASNLPVINEEGEVGDLSQVDFGTFRPAHEVLSPELLAGLAALKNRGGRPKSAAPKIQTAIRFDPDVLSRLKATGKGWQTRVNDAVREWLDARSP